MFDESPIRTGRLFPTNTLASNLIMKFTEVDRYVGKYKGTLFSYFRSLFHIKGGLIRRKPSSIRAVEKKIEKLFKGSEISHVPLHLRGF